MWEWRHRYLSKKNKKNDLYLSKYVWIDKYRFSSFTLVNFVIFYEILNSYHGTSVIKSCLMVHVPQKAQTSFWRVGEQNEEAENKYNARWKENSITPNTFSFSSIFFFLIFLASFVRSFSVLMLSQSKYLNEEITLFNKWHTNYETQFHLQSRSSL